MQNHMNTELLINRARYLLQMQHMEEHDAMRYLKDNGAKPEMAYLAVKAAKILREPYVYEEKENRIVNYEDV